MYLTFELFKYASLKHGIKTRLTLLTLSDTIILIHAALFENKEFVICLFGYWFMCCLFSFSVQYLSEETKETGEE